jgi:hypothetical protein
MQSIERDGLHKYHNKEVQKATGSAFKNLNSNILFEDELINAANGYLIILMRFMDEFGLTYNSNKNMDYSTPDYFYNQYQVIRKMFTFLTPKYYQRNKEQIPIMREKIQSIYFKIKQIYRPCGFDNDGLDFHPDKAYNLSFEIETIFQDLLCFAQEIGLLTGNPKNPMSSFGDYSD